MTAKPIKIVASVAVVAVSFVGLMFATLREDTQYYKHVDEVMSNPTAWQDKQLKLHGFVEGVKRKPNTLEYRFKVQNNGHLVQASYTGIVPDTFKEGAEVVLDGKLSADGFLVDKDGVMAKCPSKYEESKRAPAAVSGS
jgi:cytochrome c-type biogenesis protein CcmE